MGESSLANKFYNELIQDKNKDKFIKIVNKEDRFISNSYLADDVIKLLNNNNYKHSIYFDNDKGNVFLKIIK